jgi:Putative prokaryotic signal transducing protein
MTLACPSCARKYPLSERFCADCGMPLVYVGRGEEEPITESHERARKVKPQYLGGDLVKAAWARNQAEAELVQGILLEEGIPSVQRRARGFDVPDFLAGGPRDVLVPEAARDAARELLNADAGSEPQPPVGAGETSPARLAAWILIGLACAFGLVFALYQLTT